MYRFALLAVMFVSGLLGMTALGAVPDPDAFGTVTIVAAKGKGKTIEANGGYQIDAGYVLEGIAVYANPAVGGYLISGKGTPGPGNTWKGVIEEVPDGPHNVWVQMTLSKAAPPTSQVVGSRLLKNVNVANNPPATRQDGGTVNQPNVGRSQPIQINVSGTVVLKDPTKWVIPLNSVPILNVIPVDGGVVRSQTAIYEKANGATYPYAATVNINKDLKYNVYTAALIQSIQKDPQPPPYTAGSAWKENK